MRFTIGEKLDERRRVVEEDDKVDPPPFPPRLLRFDRRGELTPDDLRFDRDSSLRLLNRFTIFATPLIPAVESSFEVFNPLVLEEEFSNFLSSTLSCRFWYIDFDLVSFSTVEQDLVTRCLSDNITEVEFSLFDLEFDLATSISGALGIVLASDPTVLEITLIVVLDFDALELDLELVTVKLDFDELELDLVA